MTAPGPIDVGSMRTTPGSMTEQERARFLAEPHVGVLAISADGDGRRR